jgi:hypothetical protein
VTATDVALLVVAIVGVVGVVLLSVALVAVTRALRSLQQTVDLLRHDAVLRAGAVGSPVPALDAGNGVADRRRDAGSLLARVAVANPYLDVSDPVIKVLALASGTSRAATRFRRTRREG